MATAEFRKKVTAVFADLVGSTPLAEQLDPELFRELVFAFLERISAVIEAHGGKIEHLAGDGVLGVFGVHRSHGDDALRAVTAAVAMLDELDRLSNDVEARIGERLRMRIGVNTGTILVGGSIAGHTVSLGDPMNVAARLQARAPADGILIGEETYRLVRGDVRVERAGEISLRGRRQPMRAFRLVAVDGGHAELSAPAGRLIGRSSELGLLTVAFERTSALRAAEFVSVLGDAGVGKSRLVEELIRRYERRTTVLAARCLSYGEGITYWAVAELIRRAVGISEDDPIEIRRGKIEDAVAGDSEAEAIARQLRQLAGLDAAAIPAEDSAWAVRRLLELTAAAGPVLVVVDDLHWGEEPLLDLLLDVVRTADGPILFVFMARFELLDRYPDWQRTRPTLIALRPLSEEATDELVETLVADALPKDVRTRMLELAAGNPLFVEQFLQSLVDAGLLDPDGLRWSGEPGAAIEIPPTIEAILAARVDNLSRAERICAESAAVIGLEFWAAPLAALVAEDSAARALQGLRRKLLIEPVSRAGARADMLRFRHLLVRDAVYESIPKNRRALLHEQVADWLEQWFADRLWEVDAIIGYHYEAAAGYRAELLSGGGEHARLSEKAVVHLSAAGRQAAARDDDEQAAGFFSRVVALIDESEPTRLEPLVELGSALVRGGETARAEAVLADAYRAAAAVEDELLDARVRVLEVSLRRITSPRWWGANGRRQASELARVFAELGDAEGAARAWHLVGKAHSDRGEQAAAKEAFEHALECARAVDAPAVEAWIRYWLLQSAVFGPTACADVIERARDDLLWARTQGNRSLAGNVLARLGEMLARSGKVAEAQEAFAEARAIFDDLGRRSHLAYLSLSAAAVEPLASDPAGAELELRPAYGFFKEIGADHILATVAPMLAAALVPQDRLVEAEALIGEAERVAAPDDVDGQVKARIARAALLARRAEHAEAERAARAAVALAERTDTVLLHADSLAALAHTLIAAGQPTDAREPALVAVELYEHKGDVVSAARWQTVADELTPVA